MNDIIYPTVPVPDSRFSRERKEGFNAFHAGQSLKECPFKALGRRRTDWRSGWYMANEGREWGTTCGSYNADLAKADPKASMRAHTKAMFEGMNRRAA